MIDDSIVQFLSSEDDQIDPSFFDLSDSFESNNLTRNADK
jgi:hypothetical protein